MGINRDEIQQKAVDLSLKHKSLLLSFPTGTGKGLAVMKCILASKSEKKWLIVVPEIVQIDNWWKDAIKHGIEKDIAPKIEKVICYASFKHYASKGLNLALNEVQHLSEVREEILSTIDYDQLLMDTATLPEDVMERLPSYHEYKITMKQAVEWNILPKPEIKIHYIELDDKKRVYEKKLKSGKISYLSAKSYYEYLSNNFKYWQNQAREDGETWKQKKMFLSAINRKRFIANYKTEKAKEIVQLIQHQRFVVFCGSVKQANELGGKQAIHSKNKNNQRLIDEFNNLETSSLFACSMMKEGMNLEDIQAGLCIQLDAKDLGNIQRLGRILRSDVPEFHLICLKGTKDEEYLTNFLKEIDI